MIAASDGYFVGIPYTSRFYPELAPAFLAFAALRSGVRPPAIGAGAAYLELGCGQGYGLNLLAAANPQTRFHGVDFHAGQIANARALADAAGLTNVRFDEVSFEALLAQPADASPRFEIVVLHGVWSWVSDANRAALVQLLDRLVAPGGIVFVSYNCLPGWAPMIPLQRFVRDYVLRAPGEPQAEVVNALRAALQLCDGQAALFRNLPSLRARIAQDLKESPAYLTHEYLNAQSRPFFHADVVAALAPAGLSFAGSANLGDDQLRLSAPAALLPLVEAAGDAIWRETLVDYTGDKPFRRDVFVRGAERLGAEERRALLADMQFGLLAPLETLSFDYPVAIGQLQGDVAIYRPLAEALAEGPKSWAELAARPAFAGRGAQLFRALSIMVGARQAHPMTAGVEAGPARAFNAAALRRNDGEPPRHLAAPAAGAGVRLTADLLAALRRGDAPTFYRDLGVA